LRLVFVDVVAEVMMKRTLFVNFTILL